jgi:phiEco32-like amidoligase-type 2 protein
MTKILIGADPELFVFKGDTPVSCHDFLPGTKEDPFRVEFGAVQVDGTVAEFNIDPAGSEDEFSRNIRAVMAQLSEMLPPGHELRIQPTVEYSPEYFASLPAKAKELGCDPDFDASRDGMENERPDNTTTMRTGAGHVHLGFTDGVDPRSSDHINRCCTLIRHLDVFLGVPSLLWDRDNKRRSLYGRAGAFRPKSYGVEYRTLSNAWLRSDDLVRLVYRNSVAAVESLMAGDRFDANYGRYVEHINGSFSPVSLFTDYPNHFKKVEMDFERIAA